MWIKHRLYLLSMMRWMEKQAKLHQKQHIRSRINIVSA